MRCLYGVWCLTHLIYLFLRMSVNMPARGGNKLTLELEGPRITAERFTRAVGAFFDLIGEVSSQVSGEKKSVEWIVSVSKGSISLTAAAEPQAPNIQVPEIVRAVYTGMKELESKPKGPKFFSDRALEKARELADVADGRELKHTHVRLGRRTATAHEEMASHSDSILGAAVREAGAIEGHLQMISLRGKPHFAIWDTLNDRAVYCYIKEEQWSKVQTAFGKRVAVSGIIRYRKTGEPISIEVAEIIIFPDSSELLSASDVYGILTKD